MCCGWAGCGPSRSFPSNASRRCGRGQRRRTAADHLSRLRGSIGHCGGRSSQTKNAEAMLRLWRSIERGGWGKSLHSISGFCGGTPTPVLPRKRERERTSVVVTNSTDLTDDTTLAPSNMHRAANAPGVAEDAKITVKLRRTAGRLFRIVREFYRRPAIDRRHLADDRDRVEIDRAIRRAADEIIGQVGAPAKTDTDTAGEMAVGLLDRSDIHAVGKHQELLPGIATLLLPPFDDFLARRNRRRAVGPKASPVRDPFRRIPQK